MHFKILFILSAIKSAGYRRSDSVDPLERHYSIYSNDESNPSWVLTSLAEHLYRAKKLSLTPSTYSNKIHDAMTTMRLNESEFMDSARLWFSTVESSNEKINYCKSLCTNSDIYKCSYTAECLLVFAKETKHTWKIQHSDIDSKIYVSDYNDSFEIKTRDDIINILNQNKLIYSSFCFNVSEIPENLLGSPIIYNYSYLSNTKECKESYGTYLINYAEYNYDNNYISVGGYTTYTTRLNKLNNYRPVFLCNETGDGLVNNFGIFNFNAIVEIGEKEEEKEEKENCDCNSTNNASVDNSNNSSPSVKSSKKEKTYLGLMITFLIMFVASVPLSIIFTIKYAQAKNLGTSNNADRGVTVGV